MPRPAKRIGGLADVGWPGAGNARETARRLCLAPILAGWALDAPFPPPGNRWGAGSSGVFSGFNRSIGNLQHNLAYVTVLLHVPMSVGNLTPVVNGIDNRANAPLAHSLFGEFPEPARDLNLSLDGLAP